MCNCTNTVLLLFEYFLSDSRAVDIFAQFDVVVVILSLIGRKIFQSDIIVGELCGRLQDLFIGFRS